MLTYNELSDAVEKLLKGGDTPISDIKLDDIVDDSGNKRFVEGTPTFVLHSSYNIVSDYQKWSLSGTHLMIVGVLTANGGTSLTVENVYEVTLPTYIFSKIMTFPNSTLVSRTSALASNTSATMDAQLYKDTENNKLYIRTPATIASGVTYRIQFDLLIDSE